MKIKRFNLLTLVLVLGLILSGCSESQSSSETTNDKEKKEQAESSADKVNYPNKDILVDVEWAKQHYNDENTVFVDMRKDLEAFSGGHIPGAVNTNWGKMVDPENDVDGYLLKPNKFENFVEDLGISNDTTVVAYDDGSSLAAARLFYALEYYGHENVKVLNGGITAWLSSGSEISTEQPDVASGNFSAKAQEDLFSSQEDVENNLDSENVVLLDVRSDEEYTGENLRADRGGHIPNAVHIEWKDAMTDKDGITMFKSAEDLQNLYGKQDVNKDKQVVPYCQTNVRGAHTYFTLKLLGYENVQPYEGSWAQWGNDANTPIEN